MPLTEYKYEVDNALVCKIKLLDTAALKTAYGDEPTGAVTHDFHVSVSRNAKQFGIQPRLVRWQAEQTVSGQADQKIYKSMILPMLDKEKFDALKTGSDSDTSFSYKGLTYKPKSKREQRLI